MGAGKLYGLGILTTAVLTLLTPLIANIGLAPLVAVRILEGIFEVPFKKKKFRFIFNYFVKRLIYHPGGDISGNARSLEPVGSTT